MRSMRPEHPRVCGENVSVPVMACSLVGTSPRMRGKPTVQLFTLVGGRNIPAYAGKTPRCLRKGSVPPEHPRVCGENPPDLLKSTLLSGTSPRMRGKPAAQGPLGRWRRNIPAYAGKTTNRSSVRGCAAEHPRVCGENLIATLSKLHPRGTSPRMRGKRLPTDNANPYMRNIPAYAGKTDTERTPSCLSKEHPRVCGENPQRLARDDYQRGTSPRMRGKPRLCTIADFRVGNIPAYAGKTSVGCEGRLTF